MPDSGNPELKGDSKEWRDEFRHRFDRIDESIHAFNTDLSDCRKETARRLDKVTERVIAVETSVEIIKVRDVATKVSEVVGRVEKLEGNQNKAIGALAIFTFGFQYIWNKIFHP
jgi:predicted RNA-binding protein